MDDIKLFSKNEKKKNGNPNTGSEDTHLYSDDIGMECSIEKCAIITMKSGKRQMTEGTELPNQGKIRTLVENET